MTYSIIMYENREKHREICQLGNLCEFSAFASKIK